MACNFIRIISLLLLLFRLDVVVVISQTQSGAYTEIQFIYIYAEKSTAFAREQRQQQQRKYDLLSGSREISYQLRVYTCKRHLTTATELQLLHLVRFIYASTHALHVYCSMIWNMGSRRTVVASNGRTPEKDERTKNCEQIVWHQPRR